MSSPDRGIPNERYAEAGSSLVSITVRADDVWRAVELLELDEVQHGITIEFRCGSISRDGGSGPTGRESENVD
jgi:hypothetical protein